MLWVYLAMSMSPVGEKDGSIRFLCGFGMILFFGWASDAGSRSVPGDSGLEESMVGNECGTKPERAAG